MLKVASVVAVAAGVLAVGAPAAEERATRAAGTAELRGLLRKAIAAEAVALSTASALKARNQLAIARGLLRQAAVFLSGPDGRILPTQLAIDNAVGKADDRDEEAAATFNRARAEKNTQKKQRLMRSARNKVKAAQAEKQKALAAVPNEITLGCRVVAQTIGGSSFITISRCTTTVQLVNLTSEKGDSISQLVADLEKGASSTRVPCTFSKSVLSCPVMLDPGAGLIFNTATVRNETTVALLMQNDAGVEYGKALISAK